jgi:hypothetical protein
MRALLIALLLCVALPAAINAANRAPLETKPATTTPLNQNLLQNPGFEQVGTGASIPGWTPTGDVHVETFGTRTWPTPAYAKKWNGGLRYLACGKVAGMVSQTVSFAGLSTPSNPLLVRLAANFGGTIGHSIRVAIRITGATTQQAYKEKVKVVDITNSYRTDVTTLTVPVWATHIQANVQLMPKPGASKCRVVADTVDLWVFRA